MTKIAALLLVIFSYSCTKESFTGNNGITGKWKLSEQTSGIGINGGNWIPGAAGYVKQFQFFSDKTFEQYQTTREVPRTCNGTYELIGDTLLILHSACDTSADSIVVLTLSTMQLQLEYLSQYYRSERYSAVK